MASITVLKVMIKFINSLDLINFSKIKNKIFHSIVSYYIPIQMKYTGYISKNDLLLKENKICLNSLLNKKYIESQKGYDLILILFDHDFEIDKKLKLSDQDLGIYGLEHLCNYKFSKVKNLDLNTNNITSSGMRYLPFTHFPMLSILNLSDNNLGDVSIKYLSRCNFSGLKKLDLSMNGISDKGMEFFPRCCFKGLSELNLALNSIKFGIKFLVPFNKLENLDLNSNEIENDSLINLNSLPNLIILNLSNNELSDECVKFLIKCNLEKLKEIELGDCLDLDELKKRFPKLEIS